MEVGVQHLGPGKPLLYLSWILPAHPQDPSFSWPFQAHLSPPVSPSNLMNVWKTSSAAACRLQLKLLMGAPLGLAQLALSGYLLTTSPKLGLCSTLPGPLPPGGPSIRPECSSGSRMSARLAASTTETPVRCPLLRGLPTAPHVAAPFGLTWQCLSCSEAVFFIYVVIYSLECQYLEDKGLVRFIHKGVPGVLESVVGDCAQRMLNNHSSTNKQVAKP